MRAGNFGLTITELPADNDTMWDIPRNSHPGGQVPQLRPMGMHRAEIGQPMEGQRSRGAAAVLTGTLSKERAA